MRAIVVNTVLVFAIGFASDVSGQVPDRFVGMWIVNAASTSDVISADPNMNPENKPGWTKRWLDSEAELEIIENSITFQSPDSGTMDFSVTSAEDLVNRVVISAAIRGPSLQEEMELTVELRLSDLGELNFRIREENDFDLIIWRRRDDLPGESVAQALGTTIDYLESLESCMQGDFHLSYPGLDSVRNTILGRDGDRCNVRSQSSEVQLKCYFSVETIALLTSEVKYEEVRSGIFSGSTSAEESKRMEAECRVE